MQFAAEGIARPRQMRRNRLSPNYTTKWSELPAVLARWQCELPRVRDGALPRASPHHLVVGARCLDQPLGIEYAF
ncbi:hypothetical protein CGK74_17925 [Thauera propionica]|uniref:DUF4113 domain-containing protein n=1 Tax=Thauera propionica TaxID=2019431 RepID=A0A235ETU3_9RHOO|nr:hypothetical protein CGK74_17925 [Thauera propionica]